MGDSSNPSSLDRFRDWTKPKRDGAAAKAVPSGDPHLAGNGLRDDRPDPAATDPIRVSCSNCGAVLHAPAESGGMRGTCPTCANILPIPARGADGDPTAFRVEAHAGRPADSPPQPPPAPWDLGKIVARELSSLKLSHIPPAILLPLGLTLAGFIFYRCMGGPPAPTTKPGYVDKYFNAAKPK